MLETAIGTGLNLPFYDTAALASLTAIDLSSGMLARARQRAEQLGMADSVQLVQADVEHLQEALGGRAFDTVVDTFSLCVFPDPGAAIREMAACLRPGGVLLLLEHSRSEFGPLGWYQVSAPQRASGSGKRGPVRQSSPSLLCCPASSSLALLTCLTLPLPLLLYVQDVTAPAVMAAGKGCRWNDNVSQHVEAAGLKIKRVERHVAGLIVSVVAVKPSVGGVQV